MDLSAPNIVRGQFRPAPQRIEGEALVSLLMRLAKAGAFEDLELALRLALSKPKE